MTRETKIGLLVGLAFIIVIGILLSDHFRGAMELPQAPLDRAGPNVLQAVNTLGSGEAPPPVVVAPQQVTPKQPVPTPRDLEPRPNPVVLDQGYSNNGANHPPPPNIDPALLKVAQQNGEAIVSENVPPTPANQNQSAGPLPPLNPAVVATRQYVAQPGDSVTKMAARLMGANTKANRAAIIAANPSLQKNADRVIAGQAYLIPTATPAVVSEKSTAQTPGQPPDSSKPAQTAGEIYVVQPGDTLWHIAVSQVGDSGAVAAIQELNRDQLNGGTTLRPGMKLRLPARRIASAT